MVLLQLQKNNRQFCPYGGLYIRYQTVPPGCVGRILVLSTSNHQADLVLIPSVSGEQQHRGRETVRMSDLQKGSRRQQGQVCNLPGINRASFNYGIIYLLSFHNLKSKSDKKARTLNVDQRGVDTADRTDLSGSVRELN